jgi:predicted nucleic acid-binding protein
VRFVIDTNVVFSALYKLDSAPGRLLLLATEGAVELFAPDVVRKELEAALRGKLAYTTDAWTATLQALPIRWIEAAEYAHLLDRAKAAIRDQGDVPIVATAMLLGAAVVSWDKAFHPLLKPVVKTLRPRDLDRPRRRPRRR